MNETIKVKKTGKHQQFGEWLLSDDGSEKGKFLGCSSQVSGFLSKQIPCEVEVEERQDVGERKGVITRVKVVGRTQSEPSANQPDSPIEIVKPGITTAENYKPSPNFYETQNKTQESIITQFCIRESLRLIEVANQMRKEEDKMPITKNNVYAHALIVRQIYSDLINQKEQKSEFPDY